MIIGDFQDKLKFNSRNEYKKELIDVKGGFS